MRNAARIICFLAVVLAPSAAVAHDFSASYSRWIPEGQTLRVEFTLNLVDLHQLQSSLDADNNGEISDSELQSNLENILRMLGENFRIEAFQTPGVQPEFKMEHLERDGPTVVHFDLIYLFKSDITALQVHSTMARITQADHYHLLQIGDGDDSRQFVLDVNRPTVDLDFVGPTIAQSFRDFVVLGVKHILTGYDHLAFLIGLLLTASTLKSLIKVVTSFTVAHSVTLALATFNIVLLPARFIESLIALSIAYIAIENFLGRTLVHRWKITFLFGLVHGFGFSNVLREMELSRRLMALSLFSFNIGVEIGQLAFVCLVFPLVYYIAASRWKEQFLSAASLGIMVMGFYWFVQRAFLG